MHDFYNFFSQDASDTIDGWVANLRREARNFSHTTWSEGQTLVIVPCDDETQVEFVEYGTPASNLLIQD